GSCRSPTRSSRGGIRSVPRHGTRGLPKQRLLRLRQDHPRRWLRRPPAAADGSGLPADVHSGKRSEEHTSELQSSFDLVCRLLFYPLLLSPFFPYTTLFRYTAVAAAQRGHLEAEFAQSQGTVPAVCQSNDFCV